MAICGSSKVFRWYNSGVISTNCGTNLDHAVVAVGYGYDKSTKLFYFLIRNSWGASWGENGFAKIAQSSTDSSPGYCLINSYPYYPNVVII